MLQFCAWYSVYMTWTQLACVTSVHNIMGQLGESKLIVICLCLEEAK